MGEIRNSHKLLIAKPGWKRILEMQSHKSEDNIKMYLKLGAGL